MTWIAVLFVINISVIDSQSFSSLWLSDHLGPFSTEEFCETAKNKLIAEVSGRDPDLIIGGACLEFK